MSDLEANKAIVRRYFETFNAGSPTAVHPMCVLKDCDIRSDLAGTILLYPVLLPRAARDAKLKGPGSNS